MVAHHHLEAALDPHERLGAVRAAADQITDAEEAVASRVEAQLGERPVEGAEAPVYIADDEVAAYGTRERPYPPRLALGDGSDPGNPSSGGEDCKQEKGKEAGTTSHERFLRTEKAPRRADQKGERGQRTVEVHGLAEQLRIYDAGQLVAEHPLLEGRGNRRVAAEHRSWPPPGASSPRRPKRPEPERPPRPGQRVIERCLGVYETLGKALASAGAEGAPR